MSAKDDPAEISRVLAQTIRERILRHNPLEARVIEQHEGYLRAGIGAFHGAKAGSLFSVYERGPGHADTGEPDQDKKRGTAKLIRLGENASDFQVDYTGGYTPDDISRLWLREK